MSEVRATAENPLRRNQSAIIVQRLQYFHNNTLSLFGLFCVWFFGISYMTFTSVIALKRLTKYETDMARH